MAVSESFARVLAAGRPQFNARVAEARRRTSGLALDEFTAFLEKGVDGVVAAVDAVAPARTPAVVQAAFETALVLVASGLVGPASRSPFVDRLWMEVLPRLAERIAESPAQVLGSLSNAVVHLAATPGVRSDEWLGHMAAIAPRAASLAQLLELGKVLAWRSGAAHFRAGALAAAGGIPPEMALAALGAAAQDAWPDVQAACLADPWWSPPPGGSKGHEIGAFTGFGGTFAEPPELRAAVEGFWVRSGERYSLLVADAWGAVLLPASAEEFDASPRPSRPHVPVQQGNRLVFAGKTVDLNLPDDGLQVLANTHTVAVASPYSHAIQVFALQ